MNEKITKLDNGLVIICNDKDDCFDVWTTSGKPHTCDAPYPADVQMEIGAKLEACINSMTNRKQAIEWATPLAQDQIDTLEYVSKIKGLLSTMSEASRKATILTKEFADKGHNKAFDDVFIMHSMNGRTLRSWLEDPVFGAAAIEDIFDGVGITKGSEGYRLSRTRAANKAFGYTSQL